MAQTQQPDDFFGASYIGQSPYAGATNDYLAQLQAVHGMLQDNAQAFARNAPQFGTPTQARMTSEPSPYAALGPAQNMQVNNATNASRGPAPPGVGNISTAVSRPPMSTDTSGGTAVNRPWGEPPGGFNYQGSNIPPDIQPLRTALQAYFGQNAFTPNQQYSMLPGSDLFNLPITQSLISSQQNAGLQPTLVQQMLQPGAGALQNLLGFNAPTNISPLLGPLQNFLQPGGTTPKLDLGGIQQAGQQGVAAAQQYGQGAFGAAQQYGTGALGAAQQFGGQASQALSSALPWAQNIAATGGAPTQQLLQSVQSIQNAGQQNIAANLAAIREQYGAQGLGQGSDVSQALGLGATRGQAEIEAQQSQLLTGILQQAAQTQLGGVNALQNIAQGYGGIGQLIGGTGLGAGQLIGGTGVQAGQLESGAQQGLGQLLQSAQGLNLQGQQGGVANQLQAINSGLGVLQAPAQNALASAGIQLGAAGQYPGYANALGSAYGQSAQNLLAVAGLQQQGSQFTQQMQYQNFVRQMQTLPPALQAALGLATSFPQVYPQPPGAGATLGAAGIAAGGSILGALITAGLLG